MIDHVNDAERLSESSVLSFKEALQGKSGELDAWLECNNEAEVRAHILALLMGKQREAAPVDVENLIQTCVPGGSICDPQAVADSIRRYFGAWPESAGEAE